MTFVMPARGSHVVNPSTAFFSDNFCRCFSHALGSKKISSPIERQSTEVIGDILLTNQQGILKKVFNSDDGYNLAVARLKSEAESAALAPELKEEAEENAKNEVAKLLRLVDTSKEVKIEFKK